jgi:hypothetical protein
VLVSVLEVKIGDVRLPPDILLALVSGFFFPLDGSMVQYQSLFIASSFIASVIDLGLQSPSPDI